MMNLSLFIARRLYRGNEAEKSSQTSRPAVLIAMAGIAVGLAVMIVSVSVIVGFKSEMKDKIVGFGGHVQVGNLHGSASIDTRPIEASDSLMALLTGQPRVQHLQRFVTKPGMIKTADAFQGMVLKGVGEEYDSTFFEQHLVEGEFPRFSDSASTNRVLISQLLSQKLHLKVGDKIDTYYIQDNVRARRLTVAGIYSTNFAEFDNLFLITDLALVQRLNGWQSAQVSGLELTLHSYTMLDEATAELSDLIGGTKDAYGEQYVVQSVEQLNQQMFSWLDILDVNIWVILGLMIGVAGFTMVSGLLILIIERTSMIGLLKSLGSGNTMLRRVFLWLSVFLIGRGMFWGNLIGITLYAVQHWGRLVKLDPATYYMDTVPVSLQWWHLVLLNVGTLLITVLMLLSPSYLIARISPATSMRYDD